MIRLNYLDHVAIHVVDMEKSAAWYEEVLGLKKYKLKEWGEFPIFMLSGKCGVAIFPADASLPAIDKLYKGPKIDHFAFNVDQTEFEKAKLHYEELELKYVFQDHHYFHSIYTKDPDGHTVELTTLVVDEKEFYL
jgi:catechol 2,3-dioxygenase-like lactoylglutathione lyase family enzyme